MLIAPIRAGDNQRLEAAGQFFERLVGAEAQDHIVRLAIRFDEPPGAGTALILGLHMRRDPRYFAGKRSCHRFNGSLTCESASSKMFSAIIYSFVFRPRSSMCLSRSIFLNLERIFTPQPCHQPRLRALLHRLGELA